MTGGPRSVANMPDDRSLVRSFIKALIGGEGLCMIVSPLRGVAGGV